MKLNEHMRYPHPVLSEYSADYVSGEFSCAFEQNMTAGGELRLASDLKVSNPELAELVRRQEAAVGYFVVCRRTYFNRLQEVPFGRSEKFFDASRLFGTVVIRPVIWTLSDLKAFSNPLFNAEFGKKVAVAKGSVIALGLEYRFSIDQKKFKPFDSIFELAEGEGITEGMIAVDADQDRITILAESNTYKSLSAIRGLPRGKSILLNAVYLPAIMDVVARIQTQDKSLESRKWYRVFRARCDDLAINLSDSSQSPLDVAQRLLRGPLKKTISVMESLG